ncbi:glycosyltransferase family 4 protein [Aliiglaciecola litoralis]|uniref:Glycosyltransferase subfamily 4-like N-terminal domain-containing protein n=1 Tax=Aliiglaciecola litoralis TaxID=582857 RepID=A0ABN1LKE5_9ALTE
MKVLFVTRKWPPAVGGMETYSVELCKQLENHVDLTIRKLPGKEDGSPPSPIAILVFFISSLFFLVFNAKRYDVVHIGDFVLAPLGWISKILAPKTKTVIMIHGLDILYGNRRGLLPAIYRVYQHTMQKLYCADYFIANSENTGRLCISAGFSPVEIIPLGVNTHLPPLTSSDHDSSILFLGRLVVRKGALWFAKNVLPGLPEHITMKVVGKTWDQSEEGGLLNCHRVEMMGYVSEQSLNILKQQCMLAVMPNQPSENATDVEGFGLVAAELSMQGIPLLASNIDGITCAVLDGKTGFLVEHDNVQQWQTKVLEIEKWTAQQRQDFSRRCIAETESYFSWQRVAQDTLTLYKKLMSKGKSPL